MRLLDLAQAAALQREQDMCDLSLDMPKTQVEIDLEEKIKRLDVDRHNFTQAAIKIGKERAQFQKEKDAFEQNVRRFENEKILSFTPKYDSYNNSLIRSSSTKGRQTRLLGLVDSPG
jgi:hypothetical protein